MTTDYTTPNAVLRDLHNERRERAAPPQLQQSAAPVHREKPQQDKPHAQPAASAPRVRSHAQRLHAQRLQDGKGPARVGGKGPARVGGTSGANDGGPAHAISSDFLRHKQLAIKAYRSSYDRCADEHFSALQEQRPVVPPAARASDPVESLAEEMAGRHLHPIRQFVASEPPPPQQRAGLSAAKPATRHGTPAPASLPATDRLHRRYGL